jgi:hypothetical protein
MLISISREIGLGTVGVGKECLTEVAQCAGFVGTVGVCTVLEGAGQGGVPCIDPGRDDATELCGKETVEGKGIVGIPCPVGLRVGQAKLTGLPESVGIGDKELQIFYSAGIGA